MKGVLTRKLGPLPFWAWAVIGGGVVYWYRNRHASTSSSSGTVSYVPGYAGGGGQGLIQGPAGPPGPQGPSGQVGSIPRHHHPKHRGKHKRIPFRRRKHKHRQHHVTDDHAHGHHKALHGHHSGAQHEHRARRKRIIGRGRGSHVTHTGVHHEQHGHRQVRNEPHQHEHHPPRAGRKARGRVPGYKAALTAALPIPRGHGRPRLGAELTAASAERGMAMHQATSPPVRNRIPTPPEQGHVRRQAHPSRAERPIVLRGGRQPEHAEAMRTPHTTSKRPGQASRPESRHARRRMT